MPCLGKGGLTTIFYGLINISFSIPSFSSSQNSKNKNNYSLKEKLSWKLYQYLKKKNKLQAARDTTSNTLNLLILIKVFNTSFDILQICFFFLKKCKNMSMRIWIKLFQKKEIHFCKNISFSWTHFIRQLVLVDVNVCVSSRHSFG